MEPGNQEEFYSEEVSPSFTPSFTPQTPVEYFKAYDMPDPDLMDRAFGDQAMTLNMVQMGMLTPEYMAANNLTNNDIPAPINEEESLLLDEYSNFQEIYQQYLPFIGENKKEIFFVPEDKIDEHGYPKTNELPELYGFLWTSYNNFFDPANNYWWSQPASVIMDTCSTLWKVAEFSEQVTKQQEDYER